MSALLTWYQNSAASETAKLKQYETNPIPLKGELRLQRAFLLRSQKLRLKLCSWMFKDWTHDKHLNFIAERN
ncbi:hypothetical protein MKW98_029380 [Papaver atlanticum]|uniref:Uncharacterized protein n=1 Tax=Papaver atlanticum TaxID=357466 RepID=A0AAD4XF28_9MAGN|nr:hypothetical protein MKW98_029380 [Papaver atlanticum]